MISSSTWTSAHNDDHDAKDDHNDVDDNGNNDGDVDHNHGHDQDLDLSPRPKKGFHIGQGHAEGKFVSAKAIAIIDLNNCLAQLPVRGAGVQCRVILPCLQQVPVKCGS